MSKHHRPRTGPFSEHQYARNATTDKRARQALREARAIMAKEHGKTEKATIRHRHRSQ